MPLEKQVCSLELAKRLKELGVKQESIFYWMRNVAIPGYEIDPDILSAQEIENLSIDIEHEAVVSAFTVAELGEILLRTKTFLMSSTIELDVVDGNERLWSVAKINKVEHIEAQSKQHKAGIYELHHLDRVEIGDTEADARAKMLIYLLENNLITNEK